MLEEDYACLYALWTSCTGMGLNDIDDSKEGIGRFLARNPHTCFIAEKDGRLVGAIMAGNDGRRGYIYHTAVLPDFQKQGIGRALVHAVIEEFKQIGITKVALVVFERNAPGNLFWEKQGFSKRTDIVYRNKTLTEMKRFDTQSLNEFCIRENDDKCFELKAAIGCAFAAYALVNAYEIVKR